MEERPVIKIELTITDKILEIMSWFFIIAIWIMVLASYSKLPDTIPTHYNGEGQIDAYGGKESILILPFIGAVLFIGLSALNKFPQVYNYPTNITEDNVLRQYTYATRMNRYLKSIVVLIFLVIAFEEIEDANRKSGGLGIWFLPILIVLILIPVIYFIAKSLKAK